MSALLHPLDIGVPVALLYISHPLFPQILSGTVLGLSYCHWAGRFEKERQRAWIITTVAALVITVMALPFLGDYINAGGSLLGIRSRPTYAKMMGKVFQGYLIADLTAGALHYPSQVSLATGWGHHIVYIGVVEVAVRKSLAHIFCLCCIMELPTFLLGFSTLYPRFRSNTLFALTFLFTRIVFHVAVFLSCYKHSATLSTIPVWILVIVFPLHISWFAGCIRGFIKRRRQAMSVVASSDIAPTIVQLNINQASQTQLDTTADNFRPPNVSPLTPLKPRFPTYILRTVERDSLRLSAARARQQAYNFLGIGRESMGRFRYNTRPLRPVGIEDAEMPVRVGVAY